MFLEGRYYHLIVITPRIIPKHIHMHKIYIVKFLKGVNCVTIIML